jgi:hypothetical protein
MQVVLSPSHISVGIMTVAQTNAAGLLSLKQELVARFGEASFDAIQWQKVGSLREDARRVDNGAQVRRVAELALMRGPSVDFAGYY